MKLSNVIALEISEEIIITMEERKEQALAEASYWKQYWSEYDLALEQLDDDVWYPLNEREFFLNWKDWANK